MHIPEGMISATAAGQHVLLAGAAAATVGTAIGLYRLDYERIPKTAVLGSAFFVASAICVPVPFCPAPVHLLLGGLMGLVLGWSAFPAVLIALVLQAPFLGIGGVTTLGINTVAMALPAVICHYLFRSMARSDRPAVVFATGFAAGMLAVFLSGLIMGGSMVMAGKEYRFLGMTFAGAHMALALAEGLVTGNIVVLLRKVRPEVLDAAPWTHRVQEVANG